MMHFIAGELYRVAYQLLRKSNKPIRMSRVTERILTNLNYDEIIERRKSNAKFLYQNVNKNKYEFLYPELDDNHCLMGIPIIVQNRQALLNKLSRKGIECLCFQELWNFIPKEKESDFRNCVRFMKKHFLLPVYHDLLREQIDYLAEILNEVARDQNYFVETIKDRK